MPMREWDKIEEAEHFLAQMGAAQQDRDARKFKHNLSAFLTASRSVLQYALGKAKKGSRRWKWYDNWMKKSTMFTFFKGKRNDNIHEQPVTPKRNIRVTIDLPVQTSVHIAKLDKHFKLIEQRDLSEKGSVARTSEISVTTRYFFDDWTGSDDVLTLCQKYVNDLKLFVQDGIVKGFLTAT